MQQASRTKISTQQVSRTKSVSRGEKSYNFYEGKNHHGIIFTNKNHHTTSFTNNNQHTISPMNKINFTRILINLQLSRNEKSTRNEFQEQNLAHNNFHEQNQF